MQTLLLAVLGLVVLGALALLARRAVPAFLMGRGRRVITCPETGAPAAVQVDAAHAARTAAAGRIDLRLSDCSRWPERAGCGQECLAEIAAAPHDCLVRTMVARWYEGSKCGLCAKPIGSIDWYKHQPGLRAADGRLREWRQVQPEHLPEVLASHEPVCWDCLVVEWVVRERPDLVTERERGARPGAGRREA